MRIARVLAPLLVMASACHDPSGHGEADADAETGEDQAQEVLDPDAPPDAEDEDAGDDSPGDGGSDQVPDWTFYDGELPDVPPYTKEMHLVTCMRTRACSSHPGQLATCAVSYPSISGRMIGIILGWVAGCVVGAALDCDEITDCLTAGEEPTPCEPLVTPDRCDGTLLRQCSRFSAVDLVVDCSLLGMDCYIMDDGIATCGLGVCDPESFRPDCHGDDLVVCEGGVIQIALCDAAGLACMQDAGEPGQCEGGGDPCSEVSDPRRCEGDRIVGCIGGTLADVDCDAVVARWTCGDRGGVPGCVPSGDECHVEPLFGSDLDESCAGEAVTFCLDDYVTTLSCSDHGLGPCTDLGTAARCTPS